MAYSLHELKVHLIIWSTALFLAAGNIMNNFYDAERDLVNRPLKTRFQHLVSKPFTLRLYLLLNTIGTLLAFYASWRIGVFFVLYGLGLWFYSHKLSKMLFIRELAASILAVTAFFSLLLYFKMVTVEFMVYGFTLFLVLFSREIYKDIRSLRGDIIYGYQSIATRLGVTSSIALFQAFLFMSIMPEIMMIFVFFKEQMILQLLLEAVIILKVALAVVLPRDVVARKNVASLLLRAIIAIYIVGLAWL